MTYGRNDLALAVMLAAAVLSRPCIEVWILWIRKQASSTAQQSSSAFNMPQFSQTPLSSVIIDVNSYFGKICNYKLNSSVVGVAAYYPGIESQWGRDFPNRPYRPWRPVGTFQSRYPKTNCKHPTEHGSILVQLCAVLIFIETEKTLFRNPCCSLHAKNP